jgi:hypothetical protein
MSGSLFSDPVTQVYFAKGSNSYEHFVRTYIRCLGKACQVIEYSFLGISSQHEIDQKLPTAR